MLARVARLSRMAALTPRTSPETRVRSEASMATSVPVPRAMPTSAWASAGASLMPSPTMPTVWPASWSRLTSRALSWGSTSASTRSMPALWAIASAVRWLSPVIMTTASPWRFRPSTASRA
ncbi:hypothetical protein D3C86_1262200 [compost metagenome]